MIPEYVEVLKGFFLEVEQIGKIYKTPDPFPTHLDCCSTFLWENVLIGHNKQFFKPSTEKKYNLQEGIVKIKEDLSFLIPIINNLKI